MASSTALALAVSTRPDSHNANVSGNVANSRRANPIRAHALPRDSRSATPTSSGAYSLPTHAHRADTGALSAGRREANSSSNRAWRAAAQEVSRSNPTIASTNDSSDSPSGVRSTDVQIERQLPRRRTRPVGHRLVDITEVVGDQPLQLTVEIAEAVRAVQVVGGRVVAVAPRGLGNDAFEHAFDSSPAEPFVAIDPRPDADRPSPDEFRSP